MTTPIEPTDALTNFRILLEAYAASDLPEWEAVARTERVVTLAKGQPLTEDGQPRVYLVQRGVVGVWVPAPSGRRELVALREPGEIVQVEILVSDALVRMLDKRILPNTATLAGALAAQDDIRVEGLESARLVGYDVAVIKGLVEKHAEWRAAVLGMLSTSLLGLWAETVQRRTMRTEQMYVTFAKQRPGLVERLRQKDVASFLGASEAGLSRLMGKIRSEG